MYLGDSATERRAARDAARATRTAERTTARAQRDMARTDRMADRFARRMNEPYTAPSQEIPGVMSPGMPTVEASGQAVMPAPGGLPMPMEPSAAPAADGGSNVMPLLLGAGLLLSLVM